MSLVEHAPDLATRLREEHKARRARMGSPVTPPRPVAYIAPKVVEMKPLPKPDPVAIERFIDLHYNRNPHRLDCRRYSVPIKIPNQIEIEIMRGDIPFASKPKVPVRSIIIAVARNYNIELDDILGCRRAVKYSLPRQIAMYAINKMRKDISFPEIGRHFGGKDHTTVLHACKKISSWLEFGKLTLPPEIDEMISGDFLES